MTAVLEPSAGWGSAHYRALQKRYNRLVRAYWAAQARSDYRRACAIRAAQDRLENQL